MMTSVCEMRNVSDGTQMWTWVCLVLRSVAYRGRDGPRGFSCGAHVNTTLRTGLSFLEDERLLLTSGDNGEEGVSMPDPDQGFLDLGITDNLCQVILGCGDLCHIP